MGLCAGGTGCDSATTPPETKDAGPQPADTNGDTDGEIASDTTGTTDTETPADTPEVEKIHGSVGVPAADIERLNYGFLSGRLKVVTEFPMGQGELTSHGTFSLRVATC